MGWVGGWLGGRHWGLLIDASAEGTPRAHQEARCTAAKVARHDLHHHHRQAINDNAYGECD